MYGIWFGVDFFHAEFHCNWIVGASLNISMFDSFFCVCFLNKMCNLVVFPLISSELPLPHLFPNRILQSEVFRSLEQRRFAPQARLAKLGESILCCADSTIRLGAVVVNLVSLKATPKCFLFLV